MYQVFLLFLSFFSFTIRTLFSCLFQKNLVHSLSLLTVCEGVFMKKQGNPPYQEVLFVDTSTGTRFLCGSTLQPKEKEVYEGKEYPVYYVTVSSASHPFFTGNKQFIDTEGRVDKFLKRYARKQEVEQQRTEKEEAQKAAVKRTKKKK